MHINNQAPQSGRGRRTYSPEFKAQLVAACRISGMSVAAVARNHGINHNILHRWLREPPEPGALRLPDITPKAVPALLPLLNSEWVIYGHIEVDPKVRTDLMAV